MIGKPTGKQLIQGFVIWTGKFYWIGKKYVMNIY